VLYRRDAQLRLAECHEIRQRVRAATHESALRHTLRSVRLIAFVEMYIGKTGCPDTFGIAFASIQCRGLGRNGFAPEPKSGSQRKQSAKRDRS
jgi:hypothetical protein